MLECTQITLRASTENIQSRIWTLWDQSCKIFQTNHATFILWMHFVLCFSVVDLTPPSLYWTLGTTFPRMTFPLMCQVQVQKWEALTDSEAGSEVATSIFRLPKHQFLVSTTGSAHISGCPSSRPFPWLLTLHLHALLQCFSLMLIMFCFVLFSQRLFF